MNKDKKLQLPINDIDFKTVKLFCLVNNLKYSDLTKILIDTIKEQNNGAYRNNNL